MRIVRDYFGLDRSTVIYDNEITGIGGTAEEFYVVAEVGTAGDSASVRTTIKFSHDEMNRILAGYRHHYPLDGQAPRSLLSGPRAEGVLRWIRRQLSALMKRLRPVRRPAGPSKHRDGG